jgi:Ca2+-binding RTX toxin-like protein
MRSPHVAGHAARTLLAATIALFAMGALATSSLAGTVTYSGDGSTEIFTASDGLSHEVQFRLSSDGLSDEIYDTATITSYPGDCTPGISVPTTMVSCPGHVNAQVNLGSGNDDVTFERDCFISTVISLGDGSNSAELNEGCETSPAETATITGGSGSDTLKGGSQTTTFYAGAGDDNVYGGSGNEILHGGEGNDRLFGYAGNDQLLGEGGNDDLDGGAGNDLLDGGAGEDRLEYSTGVGGNDTGAGADTYIGGAGSDRLYYDAHPPGVNVSLDGVANDGSAGEGDNVGSDIENILGTTGNDVFTGGPGPDGFEGNSGSDLIHGGAGNDTLSGGSGDDQVYGEAGNDKVEGGSGADLVDGGPGSDQIYGDIASCSFLCPFDPDTIAAVDGERDSVDCGGGADTASVDAIDVVAFCASVSTAAAVAPAAPPTAAGSAPASGFTIALAGKASIKHGTVATVVCPAACTFSVTIVLARAAARRYGLGHRAVTIGTAHGTLLASGRKKVTVRLSAGARRKLAHATKVPATLRLSARNAAGTTITTTKAITLRK